MKILIVYLVLFFTVVSLWVTSKNWFYDREIYLSNKVLDSSIPFNVTIDEEFLESLTPANESSRTSSKGL